MPLLLFYTHCIWLATIFTPYYHVVWK